MNRTSETLGMLGQPTDAQMNDMIKALSAPDDNLSKSINPAFMGRLASNYAGLTEMSAAVLAELDKAGLTEFGRSLSKSISTATGS